MANSCAPFVLFERLTDGGLKVYAKVQAHVQAVADNAQEYKNINEVTLFLYWHMFGSFKTCAKLLCDLQSLQ